MRHFTSSQFWKCYEELPEAIRRIADGSFEHLKQDPHHPSLHFNKIEQFYSVRIGLRHRALAMEVPEGMLWFWIGSHFDYDRMIERQ